MAQVAERPVVQPDITVEQDSCQTVIAQRIAHQPNGDFAPGNPYGGAGKGQGRKPDEVVRRCNRLLKKLTYHAARKLAELANSDDQDIALRAATKILDYGRGKATEKIEIQHKQTIEHVWTADVTDLIDIARRANAIDRLPERLRLLAQRDAPTIIDAERGG